MSAFPSIRMQPLKSSQIAAIGHSPELCLLAIQFPPKRNGVSDVYHYQGISAELFEQFRTAESIGSFFIHNIKKNADKFPYSKLPSAEATAIVLQGQCDAFNESNPVGTAVIVQLDGGENRETVTTSEAQILSGHSAVIWLKGISGCYLLDRVSPVEAVPE